MKSNSEIVPLSLANFNEPFRFFFNRSFRHPLGHEPNLRGRDFVTRDIGFDFSEVRGFYDHELVDHFFVRRPDFKRIRLIAAVFEFWGAVDLSEITIDPALHASVRLNFSGVTRQGFEDFGNCFLLQHGLAAGDDEVLAGINLNFAEDFIRSRLKIIRYLRIPGEFAVAPGAAQIARPKTQKDRGLA